MLLLNQQFQLDFNSRELAKDICGIVWFTGSKQFKKWLSVSLQLLIYRAICTGSLNRAMLHPIAFFSLISGLQHIPHVQMSGCCVIISGSKGHRWVVMESRDYDQGLVVITLVMPLSRWTFLSLGVQKAVSMLLRVDCHSRQKKSSLYRKKWVGGGVYSGHLLHPQPLNYG